MISFLRKYAFSCISATILSQLFFMGRIIHHNPFLGSGDDMSIVLRLHEEVITKARNLINDDSNHTDMGIENGIEEIKPSREYKRGLNFFIVGYPKTGTSSLMHYFGSTGEMELLPLSYEKKEFSMNTVDHMDLLFERLEEKDEASGNEDRMYGIKWPGAITNRGIGIKSIALLEKYNPNGTDTKIILGLRHPVKFFESFYNFRVHGNVIENPPPTASLIGKKKWMGVSTDVARYEEGIMQLGKVPIDTIQPKKRRKRILNGLGLIDGGTPYKILIYCQEQLGTDVDKEQKKKFLDDLSSFMELKKPFTIDEDVPVVNNNQNKQHNICDSEHDEVRKVLVENGRETAKWIHANLVGTEGFVFANQDQLLSIVDSFGTDPCEDVGEELVEKSVVEESKQKLDNSLLVKNDTDVISNQ